MGVEKMSGIYIPDAKIPDGDYVRVLMLHKDGTCVDGIGNVFKVIPVPPHGRCIEADALDVICYCDIPQGCEDTFDNGVIWLAERIDELPTIIPASEETE